MPDAAPLPAGWEAVIDEVGRTYFWHMASDTVLWTRPSAEEVSAAEAAAASAAPPPAEDAAAEGALDGSAVAVEVEAETSSGGAARRLSKEEWPPRNPADGEGGAPAASDSATPISSDVRGKASFFVQAAEQASAPAAAPSSSSLAAVAGVTSLAKKFQHNASSSSEGEKSATKGQLADRMRQLQKAGVADRSGGAPGEAGLSAPTQHKVAMAALERKAERLNNTVVTSSSQHANALRGLREAQQATSAAPAGGARGAWAPKPTIERAPAASSSDGPVAGSPLGVNRAKQAFAAAMEKQSGAKTGTQMEEALRKLHGKGVVSAKKAFGTQTKEGTQRSEALKAFQSQAGTDMSTAALKRSEVVTSKPAKPKGASEDAGGGGPTQRQLAMQALQSSITSDDGK